MTKKPITLSEEEIRQRLKDLSDWQYENGKLKREIEFDDFTDAIEFIDKLALYFEKVEHHADMHIFYNKVVFDLQTFDLGGKITDLDFTVAKEINKRAQDFKKKS